jgi:hypothetical protein
MNRRGIFKALAGVGTAFAGLAGFAKGGRVEAKPHIVGELPPETIFPGRGDRVYFSGEDHYFVGTVVGENADGTVTVLCGADVDAGRPVYFRR